MPRWRRCRYLRSNFFTTRGARLKFLIRLARLPGALLLLRIMELRAPIAWVYPKARRRNPPDLLKIRGGLPLWRRSLSLPGGLGCPPLICLLSSDEDADPWAGLGRAIHTRRFGACCWSNSREPIDHIEEPRYRGSDVPGSRNRRSDAYATAGRSEAARSTFSFKMRSFRVFTPGSKYIYQFDIPIVGATADGGFRIKENFANTITSLPYAQATDSDLPYASMQRLVELYI